MGAAGAEAPVHVIKNTVQQSRWVKSGPLMGGAQEHFGGREGQTGGVVLPAQKLD